MREQNFQHTILAVDDMSENIDILKNILHPEYKVKAAISGEKALEIAQGEKCPDLILLDIVMGGIDGFETCTQLKADKRTRHIPVIFITALSEAGNESCGLKLGAVDYITKPFNPELVKARVRNQLELKQHRDELEELVLARTGELQITKEVTIDALATLAEYRDPETGGHIQRTKRYVQELALCLKDHPKYRAFLDDATIRHLVISTPLHDIGKVGVSDHILRKNGKLTAEEYEDMKKHTLYGMESMSIAEKKLGSNSFLRIAGEMALSHHEKWDGSGYPQGLKDEDIPLAGRLMAIADVYDALISKRAYKPSFSHEKAVEIIVNGDDRTMPEHFDPVVLNAFREKEEQFRQIAIEFSDLGEERASLSRPPIQ
jgi:putative two-component system response regulator